ncbi:MAG: methyltransferase domain-containing protein [Anaerolineae bacterium]|nr:methyltransferase domain-containing protein [Anaerolineae bacterium]
MLEACCGTISLALTLRQRGVDVYALNLAPPMLTRVDQAGLLPALLVQGDVTRLPFPDQTFDYILVTGPVGAAAASTLGGGLVCVGARRAARAAFAGVVGGTGWLFLAARADLVCG